MKERQIENMMTTRKSFTTVTPITVWVKGPLARSSLIMAIADAGELAIKIVAINEEIANTTLVS